MPGGDSHNIGQVDTGKNGKIDNSFANALQKEFEQFQKLKDSNHTQQSNLDIMNKIYIAEQHKLSLEITEMRKKMVTKKSDKED